MMSFESTAGDCEAPQPFERHRIVMAASNGEVSTNEPALAKRHHTFRLAVLAQKRWVADDTVY